MFDKFEREHQRFLEYSITGIRFILYSIFAVAFISFWLFMAWLVIMALWRVAFGC